MRKKVVNDRGMDSHWKHELINLATSTTSKTSVLILMTLRTKVLRWNLDSGTINLSSFGLMVFQHARNCRRRRALGNQKQSRMREEVKLVLRHTAHIHTGTVIKGGNCVNGERFQTNDNISSWITESLSETAVITGLYIKSISNKICPLAREKHLLSFSAYHFLSPFLI